MSDVDPHELPKRARVGHVLKNATVHQGAWTPSEVFWVMERSGLAEYENAESMLGLIDSVMEYSPHCDYGDDDE